VPPFEHVVAGTEGTSAAPPPARLSSSSLGRTLIRYTASGVVAAALVYAGGRVYERARLGTSDADTLRSIGAEVRVAIDGIATDLREAAGQVTVDSAEIARGVSDPAVAQRLFDVARSALQHTGDARSALTIYSPAGTPTAWTGRPSDLPIERLQGPRALFVAPGPMGPRLVFVDPRTAGISGGRTAVVAVEQVLAGDDAGAPDRMDVAELHTSFAPVQLRAPYEGAGESPAPYGFVVQGSDGGPLLEAEVSASDLQSLRARVRNRTRGVALAVLAMTAILLIVPLSDVRERTASSRRFIATTFSIAACVLAARALLVVALPESWLWSSPASELTGFRALLFRSPADLLFTSLAAAGLVVLAGTSLERRRVALRHAARLRGRATPAFIAWQLAAGCFVAALLGVHHGVLTRLVALTSAAPVHFSLHPVDAVRLTVVVGMLMVHAAVFWTAVVALRLASTWRTVAARPWLRLLALVCWIAPAAGLAAAWLRQGTLTSAWPLVSAAIAAAAVTSGLRWAAPRVRHGSQALRLIVMFAALALPSVVFFPTMVNLAQSATERMIATELAPQALAHRSELQVQLRRSLAQIDRMPDLVDLVEGAPPPRPGEAPPTDRAFLVWRQTDLARLRLTSSVELYGPSGALLSRFALNLPAEAAATQQWTETSCRWDVFGEPLAGTEDRVLLHAGRGICPDQAGAPVGAIVVHVMLDYSTLPFLTTANPYGDLFQASGSQADAHVRPIEFAMYGWGRTPIFSTESVPWPISRQLLNRIYTNGRRPLWENIPHGDRVFRVLFVNDRPGIYAIGYLRPRAVEHLVAVAEVVTLAAVAYVVLLALVSLFATIAGHRAATARALLREIRRSFYRKLFLAFVAAALVPVLALALLTRTYVAGELRDSIESAAADTAAVAKRVVENVASEQRRDSTALPLLTDEMMVWVSRIINEDVNVFDGPRLAATSQRDLFASGRLPTRTPAEVYRAILLERQTGYVGEERIVDFAYIVAASPVRGGNGRTILTVPLALRQQEVEREIDSLDRRMLLGTVVFILVAAALGYYMAERIADPVSRLTRATQRIARGDLDARIVASSADEFRRLVDAFNGMAADLQRQRAELERTNRLAAWADMARQVAHDIKNPLTPIQLSAEHLRRVHEDHQKPLSPVLDTCVDTILSQVRLLRQISSEFSSFASSPEVKLAPTPLNDIVREVLQPYLSSLGREIQVRLELANDIPALPLDRVLVGRALVNIVENALHAMPGGGTLTVRTEAADDTVRLIVVDTGVGMDDAARARLFEPYFSTRAAGTGLGLTIAKRNVELNGGSIEVDSAPGRGTVVTLTFRR
jgi:signal transduction histidine kinase